MYNFNIYYIVHSNIIVLAVKTFTLCILHTLDTHDINEYGTPRITLAGRSGDSAVQRPLVYGEGQLSENTNQNWQLNNHSSQKSCQQSRETNSQINNYHT